MPFDGNGNYALPSPAYPAVSGATITAANRNTIDADLQNALSNCVTRDGQSPPTANLPMGSFKLTGLAAGTASGNSVRYEQVLGLSRFRAIVAAQVIADNTLTTILFNSESFDTGVYAPGTGRFTAAVAGQYQINVMLHAASGIDNGGLTVYVYKNGVMEYLIENSSAGTHGFTTTISDFISLAAADYIEIKVLQQTGGNWTYAGFFSAFQMPA